MGINEENIQSFYFYNEGPTPKINYMIDVVKVMVYRLHALSWGIVLPPFVEMRVTYSREGVLRSHSPLLSGVH